MESTYSQHNYAIKSNSALEDKYKLLWELDKLKEAYNKATDAAQRHYLIVRMQDFTDSLIDYGFNVNELRKPYTRLGMVNSYGRLYEYSLSENLKEQKTITSDSIQSSPLHLKQLELNNTAMVTMPEFEVNRK